MQDSHETISRSLIRGILFAAIFCLLFTGTVGADDSPYLNIQAPTTIFPEYPANAVFTFSSSGCTDLKVNYGDGTEEVELTSTSQTLSHTYTQQGTYVVWLNATVNGNKYSTSKQIVVKPYPSSGSITITSTQNIYYLLEPFTVFGTNTYSDSVRLYIDGSNFEFMEITDNAISVSEGQWSFIVDTSAIYQTTPLDAGTYRIYAVVGDVDISFNELDEFKYNVVQVQFQEPTIQITSPQDGIPTGTDITITGIAYGADTVSYCLFGDNKLITGTAIVDDADKFSIDIPTTDFESGIYSVIVHHPMYDKEFNIYSKVRGEYYDFYVKYHGSSEEHDFLFSTEKYTSLLSAGKALCDSLKSQNIDDIYTEVAFVVTPQSDDTEFITITNVEISEGIGELSFSGLNSENNYVHLYLESPSGIVTYLTENPISSENLHWETVTQLPKFKEIGTYTIYAVASDSTSRPVISEIKNGAYTVWKLENTLTASLKAGGVEIADSINQNKEAFISGNAKDALQVQYYILGNNYWEVGTVATNSNGDFTIPLEISSMAQSTYYVVIQNPGDDALFNVGPVAKNERECDVYLNTDGSYDVPGHTLLFSISQRQGHGAALALCELMRDSNIDDSHTFLAFSIVSEDAEIEIPDIISYTIPLTQGWNFISVPKYLDTSCDTAGELFASLDTGGMSHLGYDTKTGWYTLKADTPIKPLDGYWVYSKTAKTINLAYSADVNVPPTKTVYKGWNAVGLSAETSMTAKSAFSNLNWVRCIPWDVEKGKWGTVIVKGGSAENSEELKLKLGNGNWLYVEADGAYTGNTA